MKNIAGFFIGFWRFLFKNVKTEMRAKRRAAICFGCPHREKMRVEIIKDKKITNISAFCCELCGCRLSILVRQDKKLCDAGKW